MRSCRCNQLTPHLPLQPSPVRPTPGTTMVGRTGPGRPVLASTVTQTKRGKATTNTYSSVINLSNYNPNADELELLGMGLTYIPTPHTGRFSEEELVADFETLRITHMARYCGGLPTTSDRIKTTVCDNIVTQLQDLQPKRTVPNLPVRLTRALRKLRSCPETLLYLKQIRVMPPSSWIPHATLAWRGSILRTGKPTRS